MSAQAGIFYFDGRPIRLELAQSLLASLAEHGSDSAGFVIRRGLVMVHRAMHVTPDDAREKQPIVAIPRQLLTWDGRLDNRADLLAQRWNVLRTNRLATDAELACAVIASCGIAGLDRLIGDWSLAGVTVTDDNGEMLVLASDFAGNRPLFYAARPEAVHWSTSLAELVTRLRADDALDPRYLVGFLTNTMPPEVTPYAGVRNVRPAHAVCWTRDGRQTATRFWTAPAGRIRYRRDEEYEEHLRCLFAESVRGRLRATRPVWIELSGGLDSTGVCCMATMLARSEGAAAPAIKAISAVSDRSRESDESRFIAKVQEHCDLDVRRLTYEQAANAIDDAHGWIAPTHPSALGLQFLRTVAHEDARMLVTGHPGDLVMGNVSDRGLASVEAWREGARGEWLRFGRAWSRRAKEPIWSLLAAVRDYTGDSARLAANTIARELRARGAAPRDDPHAAAADVFALPDRLTDLWMEEVTRRAAVARAFDNLSRRPFVHDLQMFTETRLLESPSGFTRARQTHAYMHRPLVEFALGIPARVLHGAHEPRRLMRRAFDGFMPPHILRRFSKGYAAPLLMRDLRATARLWLPTIPHLHIISHGLVPSRPPPRAPDRAAEWIGAAGFEPARDRAAGTLAPPAGAPTRRHRPDRSHRHTGDDMNNDRIYEPPVLARVCDAPALILGGSSGPNDSPVDPPTLLNGALELGLDD